MNQEPIEQNAPALGASRHLPALVIDLNALAASGEPQPQVLEQAQEAVRQALQHVFGQPDEWRLLGRRQHRRRCAGRSFCAREAKLLRCRLGVRQR